MRRRCPEKKPKNLKMDSGLDTAAKHNGEAEMRQKPEKRPTLIAGSKQRLRSGPHFQDAAFRDHATRPPSHQSSPCRHLKHISAAGSKKTIETSVLVKARTTYSENEPLSKLIQIFGGKTALKEDSYVFIPVAHDKTAYALRRCLEIESGHLSCKSRQARSN